MGVANVVHIIWHPANDDLASGIHIKRDKHYCPILCDECFDTVQTETQETYSFAEAAKQHLKDKQAIANMEADMSDDDKEPNNDQDPSQHTTNQSSDDSDGERQSKVPRTE